MNKVITYLSLSSLFIAGYCLFAIKGEVHDINYRLSETSKQIADERNSLNILKAEFAVLQSPERLRALADRHLELVSIKSDQVTQDLLITEKSSDVSVTLKETAVSINPSNLKHNIKWRFKNSSSRRINRDNLKKVSYKGKKK